MADEDTPHHGTNGPPKPDSQTAPTARIGKGAPGSDEAPGHAAPLLPQSTIGPFRLASVLGSGGMGVVYEAHDEDLERSVAVKLLRSELAQDAEVRSRFLYEAKLLGQMDHPGIVPVFTAGSLGASDCYYAMKKIRGQTLRDILKGMLPEDFRESRHRAHLLDIFEKVCDTVAYAHSQGILHRDLKPANIMVDEFGVVLVLDWGLSKRITASAEEQGILATQVGTVKGTAGYMSPEQARGGIDQIDYRADVFSLGIILYELLTGALPFSGKSRTEVMHQIVYREPSPPRALNPKASRALSAICMKALSKDPAERYFSAGALAEDIRLQRDYLPISAYKPGPLERAGNWVWRHTELAAAIGTAALLLLLFGGLAWHQSQADRIRRDGEEKALARANEMAAERDRQKAQESLRTMKEAMTAIRGLDQQILDLKAKKASLKSLDPAQPTMENQLDELETVRFMVNNNLRMSATRLITEVKTKQGVEFSQLDPELLGFLRGMVIDSLESYMRRGEHHKAHYTVSRVLRKDRPSRIQWTPEDVAKLTAIHKEAEAKLLERSGPGGQPPDWRKYDKAMSVFDRDLAPASPPKEPSTPPR